MTIPHRNYSFSDIWLAELDGNGYERLLKVGSTITHDFSMQIHALNQEFRIYENSDPLSTSMLSKKLSRSNLDYDVSLRYMPLNYRLSTNHFVGTLTHPQTIPRRLILESTFRR